MSLHVMHTTKYYHDTYQNKAINQPRPTCLCVGTDTARQERKKVLIKVRDRRPYSSRRIYRKKSPIWNFFLRQRGLRRPKLLPEPCGYPYKLIRFGAFSNLLDMRSACCLYKSSIHTGFGQGPGPQSCCPCKTSPIIPSPLSCVSVPRAVCY